MTVDMREKAENGLQITYGKTSVPADATFRMTSETFDALSNREMKGYAAALSGKVKIDGGAASKFRACQKWDKIVVTEYLEKIDERKVPGLDKLPAK